MKTEQQVMDRAANNQASAKHQDGPLGAIATTLASDIEKVADQIRSLTDSIRVSSKPAVDCASQAKLIYRARRKADEIADIQNLSASPAFDNLLDLYISACEGRPVSVSSACIGAACPPTTALRWIHHLVDLGLVARTDDPDDRRRAYLTLTNEGRTKIEGAIAQYAA